MRRRRNPPPLEPDLPAIDASSAPARPGLVVALGCTALLLLQWIASFLPGHLVWGFNHLAYVPVWARTLWTVIALALLWGPGPLHARVETGFGRFLGRGIPAATVLAAAGAALFYLLRCRTFFLGDGYLVAELVDNGARFRTYDLADFYLHAALWRALGGAAEGGVSAFRVYAALSIAAGAAYLASSRWVSVKLAGPPDQRALLFALFTLAGPLQIFFGYVESYSIQTVFILLYLGSAVLVLRDEAPAWRAGIFFGLALAFHTTTLFLGPTLAYLILFRKRGILRRAASALLPALGVLSLAVGVLVLGGYTERHFVSDVIEGDHSQALFVPLSGSHGLLSLYHLKDLVNLQLLLAPVPLLLLAASFRRSRRILWETVERRFLTIGCAFLLVMIVCLDRKLGGARDWDLFAPHAAAFVLLGYLAYRAGDAERRNGPAAPRAPGKAGFILAASFFLSAPWFWVNGSEARSVARFRDIIEDFPAFRRAYSHEEIAKHFRNRDNHAEALEEYRICVETFPKNPRFRVLLGGMKYILGDIQGAKEEYEASLEINPDYEVGLRNLVQVYQEMEMAEEALPLLEKLVTFPKSRGDPDVWRKYGFLARQAGRGDAAVVALQNAFKLDPSPRIRLELGVALGIAGRWDEAVKTFEELREDPEQGGAATLGLGTVLTLRARQDPDLTEDERSALKAEARRILEGFAESYPQSDEVTNLLKELDVPIPPPGETP